MSQPTSCPTVASLTQADRIALAIIATIIVVSGVFALAGF